VRLTALLCAAALACGTRALQAQTVITESSTAYRTSGLSSARTFGSSMAGMGVTAHFANGATATATWGDLGEGLFGAQTSLFRLTFPGDVNTGTFDYDWRLTNASGAGLTRLVLSGAAARTVFDLNGDEELTPNSALGIPLQFRPDLDEDGIEVPSRYAVGSTVTYRNAVRVGTDAPLGDVFEQVDLVFGTALAGGLTAEFIMDSDSVGEGDSIGPLDPGPPPATTVPEPSTVALVAGGLAALAAGRRPPSGRHPARRRCLTHRAA
jgi:hypothetical protein